MPRIQLRPLTPADRPELSRLVNNKKIWDNLRDRIPHPYTERDADDFFRMTAQESPRLNFAIEYEGRYCGGIGLIPGVDIYRRGAEIGYWVGEPFWGKGIATEALRLLVAYGFGDLGLIRLQAGVMAHNPGSMKVLEHNGFELEGIFKKAIFKNGLIVDEYRYARTV